MRKILRATADTFQMSCNGDGAPVASVRKVN